MNRAEISEAESPGVRRWLISCDESGVHGASHYGFGLLWMRWQRRGDFSRELQLLREKHRFHREIKWTDVHSDRNMPFYEDLVTFFFQKSWFVFHCLVVRTSLVEKHAYHKGDEDLARRKHFTKLLTNKIEKALLFLGTREQEFIIHVDPIASYYPKADEAVEVISNRVVRGRAPGSEPIKAVLTRNSKEAPAIQLCDFFLGAVMETWQQKAKNRTKSAVRKNIAQHLGWPDLDSDTRPNVRKFNIWYFHDPKREVVRKVPTREVILKYPYPPAKNG